ncbi:hypothetical protein VNI00_018972 [Paramarasmius palmivorus]|uniref:Uncharacterized protein n=1 Tax=Paramarasmius palmivorus TaxID=297713 RepID=A0AAW0ASV2_9AGAR
MNEDWVRQATQARVASSLSGNKGHRYIPGIKFEARVFNVVGYYVDNVSPCVYSLQDPPKWPYYSILDPMEDGSSSVLRQLLHLSFVFSDSNIETTSISSLEFYNVKIRMWTTVSASFKHHITTNDTLFFRLPGVKDCLDLDDYLSCINPVQASTSSPHLRNNISGERKAVRESLRMLKEVIVIDDDDERPSKRLQRSSPSSSPSPQMSPLPSPVLPELPLTPSIPSTLLPSPQVLSSELPDSSDLGNAWPGRIHCSDIASGFQMMAADQSAHLQTWFQNAFPGFRYVQGTYFHHLKKWQSLTERQRAASIALGRTDGGVWKVYRKTL